MPFRAEDDVVEFDFPFDTTPNIEKQIFWIEWGLPFAEFQSKSEDFLRQIVNQSTNSTSDLTAVAQVQEAYQQIMTFLNFDDDAEIPKTCFPPLTMMVALSIMYGVSIALWVHLDLEEAADSLDAPLPDFWTPHLAWLSHLPAMLGPTAGCPISDRSVPALYVALSLGLSQTPVNSLDTVLRQLEKKSRTNPTRLTLSKPGNDLDRAKKSVNDAFARPLKFLLKLGESGYVHLIHNQSGQHCQPIVEVSSVTDIASSNADGRCLLHSFWLAAKGETYSFEVGHSSQFVFREGYERRTCRTLRKRRNKKDCC